MPSVFYSTVIKAPVEQVWSEIRDFGKLADWHPLIADCAIEDETSPFCVGCVRRFHLDDGSLFRERLLAMNEFKRTFSYAIEESPLPLEDYVATVKLVRVTDGDWTFASWSSSFVCPTDAAGELTELVENGVYKSGLDAIKKIVE